MTDEQKALARRAVACRGWTWGPGMLDLFGRRVRNVWPDDLGINWSHIPENCVVRDADALPDLTDAATIGCLLALVRAAWGCAVITSPEYDYDDEARQGANVIGWRAVKTAGWWMVGEGASEAEALVAALEGAHDRHGPLPRPPRRLRAVREEPVRPVRGGAHPPPPLRASQDDPAHGGRVTLHARCETCRWSAEGARAGGPVLECHRAPPSSYGWPAVRPTDRCGEHAPDGWRGFTEAEKGRARQIAVAQAFFRRLAQIGRG